MSQENTFMKLFCLWGLKFFVVFTKNLKLFNSRRWVAYMPKFN